MISCDIEMTKLRIFICCVRAYTEIYSWGVGYFLLLLWNCHLYFYPLSFYTLTPLEKKRKDNNIVIIQCWRRWQLVLSTYPYTLLWMREKYNTQSNAFGISKLLNICIFHSDLCLAKIFATISPKIQKKKEK